MNDRLKATLSPTGTKVVRASALMIAVGVLVQLVTLTWDHPTAFVVFAVVGGLLVALGVIGFFWSRFL